MLLAHYKIKVKCVGTGYLAVSLTLTGVSPDLQATHSDCMYYSFPDLCWQHSNVLTSRHHYTPRLWIHLDGLCFNPISILPLAAQAKSGQPCLQVASQSSGKAPHCFKLLVRSISQAHGGGSSQVPDDFEAMLSFVTMNMDQHDLISKSSCQTQRKFSQSVSCLFLASC